MALSVIGCFGITRSEPFLEFLIIVTGLSMLRKMTSFVVASVISTPLSIDFLEQIMRFALLSTSFSISSSSFLSFACIGRSS